MQFSISSITKIVKVTSKQKTCPDSEDDKIINLTIDSNCHNIITKNISDLKCTEKRGIKTRNGKNIEIDTPENYIKLIRLRRWHNKNQIGYSLIKL